MKIETRDTESIRKLRARRDGGDDLFFLGDGLAVLDPHHAQAINAENFTGVVLPDRLIDLLRRRESPRIRWQEVRATWIAQLAKLAAPEHVQALEGRLEALIEERLGHELDLPWAIQEIFSQALFPTVIADLSPGELERLRRDQHYKLTRLMRSTPRDETRREKLRSGVLQLRAGAVVRRVLRGRARGRRPRRLDLADPIVDLLPTLGMDRAAFAVTTVLTAIAGPPGAVAVCMLLELVRRPGWAARLREELDAVADERFYRAATRAAPVTHRFVKETLRMWSAPLVLTRVARVPLRVADTVLGVDQIFNLSPYFAHHGPRDWDDPEVFDPDRWLPGADRGPRRPCAYAPFGWAPTSCIGAGMGLTELMLLCRLFSTRYRLEAVAPERVEMVMASVPLPIGFRGTITRS